MRFAEVQTRDDIGRYLSLYHSDLVTISDLESKVHAIATGRHSSIVQISRSKTEISNPVPKRVEAIMLLRHQYEDVTERWYRTRQALTALSWEEEKVVRARYIDGLHVTAIADKLPAARQTVYNRLNSAMETIAETWGIS